MEQIVSLIGSLGFPIVACYFLWKFIDSTLKDFSKSMAENTKMLAKLCDSIDRITLDRTNKTVSGQPERGDDDGKFVS